MTLSPSLGEALETVNRALPESSAPFCLYKSIVQRDADLSNLSQRRPRSLARRSKP